MTNVYANAKQIIKTSFTAAAVMLLFILLPGTGKAQNLVLNPSFTNGSLNWSTACSIEINPEAIYGGSSVTNLTTEIDVERCINQTVCILPGVDYTFTFKASRRTAGATPAMPGVTVRVMGTTTNTLYVDANRTFNNTTFNFQTQTFSFTIPAGSADRKVNVSFSNYSNTSTYGVILDDISLAPTTDFNMNVNGPAAAGLNSATSWLVSNAPVSGISYNWNFGSGAATPAATSAKPNNIKWNTLGTKTVTAVINNGTCDLASLSANITIMAVLPVQLVSFTGEVKANKGLLNWVVDNEVSNSHFVIERSKDGNTFEAIGKVTATNSNGQHSYTFTDAALLAGNNFYRLHQVDNDGNSKNSATVVLKSNNTTAATTVQVYPNPATGNINYQLTINQSTTAAVEIFDANGKMLMAKKQLLTNGVNQNNIDIAALPAGMFFLKVTGENGSIQSVKTFSKLK